MPLLYWSFGAGNQIFLKHLFNSLRFVTLVKTLRLILRILTDKLSGPIPAFTLYVDDTAIWFNNILNFFLFTT